MRGGFIRISQTGDISENVFFFVYLFLMIRLREEINMNNVEERRRHYNISHFSICLEWWGVKPNVSAVRCYTWNCPVWVFIVTVRAEVATPLKTEMKLSLIDVLEKQQYFSQATVVTLIYGKIMLKN